MDFAKSVRVIVATQSVSECPQSVFQPDMLPGELPRKTTSTAPEICCRSQFLERHTLLLEYKKKPFVPDAVPGRQISQNCSCCWAAPHADHLEKQLTALLIAQLAWH